MPETTTSDITKNRVQNTQQYTPYAAEHSANSVEQQKFKFWTLRQSKNVIIRTATNTRVSHAEAPHIHAGLSRM